MIDYNKIGKRMRNLPTGDEWKREFDGDCKVIGKVFKGFLLVALGVLMAIAYSNGIL